MSVKDFLLQIPFLCHAKNPERWSRIIELQYDDELKCGSVFDKNELDAIDPRNRRDTAFGFSGDYARTEHCKNLVDLLLLSHARDCHGETKYNDLIDKIREKAFIAEIAFPDIEAVMSAEQASAISDSNGTWNI